MIPAAALEARDGRLRTCISGVSDRGFLFPERQRPRRPSRPSTLPEAREVAVVAFSHCVCVQLHADPAPVLPAGPSLLKRSSALAAQKLQCCTYMMLLTATT